MRALPRLDFAFTQQDSPALRRRIQSDLTLIAQRCALADPSLVALVLTGGFSRGEGTARSDAPVNDYDLVAVRSRPGGGPLYRALSAELSKRVGLEVDLLPIARFRLPRVGRKLFWLDLRLGGRVILGDANILDEVRPLDAPSLGRGEGARLLGNRAAGLLLALPGPGGAIEPAQCDLQATKAALAAMDARLLFKGRYAARLQDRLELSRNEGDIDIFKTAVQWKLGGSATVLGEPWWRAARGALLRAVVDTNAENSQDGWVERLVALSRARRPAWNPSAAVRARAWQILRDCDYPTATGEDWPSVKRSFFDARAKTLQ